LGFLILVLPELHYLEKHKNSLHTYPVQPEQAEEEFLTVYQAFLQYIRFIPFF